MRIRPACTEHRWTASQHRDGISKLLRLRCRETGGSERMSESKITRVATPDGGAVYAIELSEEARGRHSAGSGVSLVLD